MNRTNQHYVQRCMRGAQTRQQQCYQNAGHCLKEKDNLFPFVKKMPFFFYACIISFSCKGPLGVTANLIVFFFFFFLNFNLKFF